MWCVDVNHGMYRQIVNIFHVLSGKLKGKIMELYSQELEMLAGTLTPDIQPYVFGQSALRE